MKPGRKCLGILSVCAAGIVRPRTAAADEWHKRTILTTFNQPVETPARFYRRGPTSFSWRTRSRAEHVVQVFDQEGRILATMLTITTVRPAASDDARIMFDEQRAGAPFPLKKWLYPGERGGEEFLYPTHSN